MVKRTIEELSTYNAPGHHGCTCMRYHGKEETGASKFWMGMSVFLPGGGADYAYDTVTARYHSGAVILLHAVSKDNADALGRMIDKAREDGYVWKSLDEYYE